MNEILRKLLDDDSISFKSLSQLEQDFEAEIQKPSKERDYDLLDEIGLTIMEMKGVKTEHKNLDEIADNILKKSLRQKRAAFRKRLTVTVTCLLVLLLSGNILSQKVYGMNVLSAIVQISTGKISFNFKAKEVIKLSVSADDPYGLKAECKVNGFESVLLPTFLPEDFKLTEKEFTETPEMKLINFVYTDNKKQIDISIFQYQNQVPDSFQIPTEKLLVEELTINGKQVIILNDGDYYRSSFCYNNTIYTIDVKFISRDLLIQILNSVQ